MKRMKSVLVLALVGFAIVASAQPSIVPKPVSMQLGKGQFVISSKTVIAAQDEEDRRAAALFNDYLQSIYGFRLDIDRQESKNYIRLVTRKFIRAPDKDAYQLSVGANGVLIEGDTYAGTFYGLQTLMQLLPVEKISKNLSVPFITISDYPRFSYRGMHLDVARHFFDVNFVKKYIDYLSYHKMNTFHWHLTDDQGWRIEIRKYPELTAVGGYRNGTIIGRYPGTGNDQQHYGGWYTQAQIKEVIAYAAARHITIIPEIEMPGHASAAIAAFPWLSCFPEEPTKIPSFPSDESNRQQAAGKPKMVQETWGVFDDVFCAGKDSTFTFLENVLSEVIELFPSTIIHVGGDECPKANWKRCPQCQQRMRTLGLKDEHELQSYFIQRMEKFLNGRGRKLLGWDEILEGGLAPNAMVMSWRGEQGGIDAARQHHEVVMTPQNPVYFDHTQVRNEDSVVIGGYNPLEAVYAYDPLPKALDTSLAKYIRGGQANLWTEYIAYPSKVEYMVFPRMSALSEILWSPATARSFSDFEKRLPTQMKRYELWHANYSRGYYALKASIQPAPNNKGMLWKLESTNKNAAIRYRYKGVQKNYTAPLLLSGAGTYDAELIANGEIISRLNQTFHWNKATGKKISVVTAPNSRYPGQGGAFGLVNGVYSQKGLAATDWLAWIGDDLVATIDLGSVQTLDSVRMHTLEQRGSWVYLPSSVEVELSTDGKRFSAPVSANAFRNDLFTMGWFNIPLSKKRARYIRLKAKNSGVIPDGLPGGGNKAWLFADEIEIY